jgi:5S rRNA maturation endonuclease (ribonuclease M5)
VTETDNPFRDIPAKVTIFMLLDSLGIQHKGKDAKMTCPYRHEKTPGWSVFKQGTKWKDHVDTSKHGDVIDLYMEMHPGCEKKDALRSLAALGGMTLKSMEKGDLPTPAGRYRGSRRPEPLADDIPPHIRSILATEIIGGRDGVAQKLLVGRKGISKNAFQCFAYEASIGTGISRDLLIELGATEGIIDRGSDPRSLLYIMGKGIKCRPKSETSHADHWLVGKASENLFRGEALLGLEDPTIPVLITEGETDALVLQEELWAVGSRLFVCGGLGGSWVPDFRIARRYLRGRNVYIVGDNDKPGDEFSKRLKAHLLEVAGCKSVASFRWHRDLDLANDIGEIREKNLMENFISLLRCKKSWV